MARTRRNVPDAVKNAPKLDLNALAAEAVEDKMTPGGTRFAFNPFVAKLRESYAVEQAGRNGTLSVKVPAVQVRDIASALQNATNRLAAEEIGSKIRYVFTDPESGTPVETSDVRDVPEVLADGSANTDLVTVKFVGRKRRIHLKKEEKEDAIARGFVLDDGKVDAAAYVKWLSEQDEDDEDEDEDDEYDENDDE